MFQYIRLGGPYMYLIAIIALANLVLIIKKGIDLFFRSDREPAKLERGINAIMFWGALAVPLGYLAYHHGIFAALTEIIVATDISPQIVMMGYQQALIPIFGGWITLVVSAVCWFVLRWRYNALIK